MTERKRNSKLMAVQLDVSDKREREKERKGKEREVESKRVRGKGMDETCRRWASEREERQTEADADVDGENEEGVHGGGGDPQIVHRAVRLGNVRKHRHLTERTENRKKKKRR
jgi:hypothetical protein